MIRDVCYAMAQNFHYIHYTLHLTDLSHFTPTQPSMEFTLAGLKTSSIFEKNLNKIKYNGW